MHHKQAKISSMHLSQAKRMGFVKQGLPALSLVIFFIIIVIWIVPRVHQVLGRQATGLGKPFSLKGKMDEWRETAHANAKPEQIPWKQGHLFISSPPSEQLSPMLGVMVRDGGNSFCGSMAWQPLSGLGKILPEWPSYLSGSNTIDTLWVRQAFLLGCLSLG